MPGRCQKERNVLPNLSKSMQQRSFLLPKPSDIWVSRVRSMRRQPEIFFEKWSAGGSLQGQNTVLEKVPSGSVFLLERFPHHCSSEKRWGAGKHIVLHIILLRIFWDGSRGVNSFIRKSFSQTTKMSRQAVSREFGKWEVFRCPKWVAVARYGLSMGGNESHGFWEAFGTPPGPPGGHENLKNPEKKLENPGFRGRRHGRSH